MLRSTLFWILAFVITAGSAVFQRKTGPTWAVDGEVSFANSLIKYELDRSHEGKTDHKVEIEVLDKNHIILATKKFGIGIYNSKQMIFVRPKSINDRARMFCLRHFDHKTIKNNHTASLKLSC